MAPQVRGQMGEFPFSPASHSFIGKVGEGGTQFSSSYPAPGERGAEMVDAQAEGSAWGETMGLFYLQP